MKEAWHGSRLGLGGGSFGEAALGDRRRTKRLVRVGAAFYAGCCSGGVGTICSVIPGTHQAKAAYRLLDNASVTHEAVVAAHCQHVRRQLDAPGVTLLIEDTTAIAYPGLEQSAGLGPIGEAFTRGYWLHSTLAVRWTPATEESATADSGTGVSDTCWPIGLAHQYAWARPQTRPPRRKSKGRGKESNSARQKRDDRESVRWAAGLAALATERNPDTRLIYVADRESDIYEVFGRCRDANVGFVIRAVRARAVEDADAEADLMSAAADAPVRGHLPLDLPRQNRQATLAVRSTTLELRGPPRPGGRPANLTLNVLRVREINAPADAPALEWTLLTDQPLETSSDCQRVLRIYRCRWMIEEFHKALKTGLGLELSQLSDYRRLSALAGIVSVVAVHLLQLKYAARTPNDPPLAPEQQREPMVKLLIKLHPPKGVPTVRWLWTSIARLGGHLARKSDGPPGWLTLWRGWRTMQYMLIGYQLAEP